MKFEKRPSTERGHYDAGWLDTYHTFSFSTYRDPKFNQFGPLRVLNEDCVEPSSGFPMHPHQNYEIFSYILSGNLTHSDSMGNTEICKKGSVQFTSAGSGIYHSEFNRDKNEHVKFLQIWVKPRCLDTKPNYQKMSFSPDQKLNQLCLMIAPKDSAKLKEEELIGIDQDFYALSSLLESGKKVNHTLYSGRQIYVHVPIMSRTGSVSNSKSNGLLSSLLRKTTNTFITNYLKTKFSKTKEQVSIKLSNNSHGNGELITLNEGDGCFIQSDSLSEEELIIEGVNSMTEFVVMDMKK